MPGAPASSFQSGLVSIALIIAGLYVGQDVIVPLVLAVLLAFVLAPIVSGLRRFRVPQALAAVLAVVISASAVLGLGMVMTSQAGGLVGDLPRYRDNLRLKIEGLHLGDWVAEAQSALGGLRGMVGSLAPATPDAATPQNAVVVAADAGLTPLEMVQSIAGPVLAPLATGALVVLFAIFILIYREDLRDRVIRLAGSRDLHRTTVALNDAAGRLSRLYLAQVGLNMALGVLITAILWFFGLPAAALWGILAGLMRFVPFLGTFIAVLPPVLLAAAIDPGWSTALWVLGLILVAEIFMGQVVEPMVFGHSTGLAPVAVLVATVFWTFIWGPIGLLMATPLTVCLVVLGRHVPRFAVLEVILGDRPSLRPEESFYQRVLENDAVGLQDQARLALQSSPSVIAYIDGTALPALVLADQDWASEVIEPERLEQVRERFATLLTQMEQDQPPRTDVAHDPLCLCIPGRGRLDDLSASMSAFAMQTEGCNAAMVREDGDVTPDMAARARLGCICVLEESSSASSIRYLIRRWEKLCPGIQLVVGLWHISASSPLLAQIRAEGGGRIIVTSIGELVALWRASSPVSDAAA